MNRSPTRSAPSHPEPASWAHPLESVACDLILVVQDDLSDLRDSIRKTGGERDHPPFLRLTGVPCPQDETERPVRRGAESG